ncbi:MAG: protein translocase subunit SecF [Clostridia bacterium]|nr:protein translocase subunit SecF [Clostridia bacterium]
MAVVRYDLMRKKNTWFIISLLIIIPGIISLAIQGLNLGIDFTGGNLWHLRFIESTSPQEIRNILGQFGLEGSKIQSVSDQEYIVRMGVIEEKTAESVLSALDVGVGEFEMLRNEHVGPTIGREIANKAIVALVIAAAIMLAYITYRFEFSFAIAAIIALIHDVLVTLGIFSIFQIEVESAFIAAILTVIGYSINDTIVIFDRIRENLKYRKGGTLEQLVNASIWQTMTRSINTSLTLIFVLIAMLLFGGTTTKVFIMAMLIGVVSGAYSSIFIASPVWLEIKSWEKKKKSFA